VLSRGQKSQSKALVGELLGVGKMDGGAIYHRYTTAPETRERSGSGPTRKQEERIINNRRVCMGQDPKITPCRR